MLFVFFVVWLDNGVGRELIYWLGVEGLVMKFLFGERVEGSGFVVVFLDVFCAVVVVERE